MNMETTLSTDTELVFRAVPGIPMVRSGDDLPSLLLEAVKAASFQFYNRDILVVAQKIVSKAEGRIVKLSDVRPGARAIELAGIVDKDPRLVELILSETAQVVRTRPGLLIVRHRLGFVMANAGIDQSNISHSEGEAALLLPLDPDASCHAIADHFRKERSVDIGVIMVDSIGRAWRNGTIGTAIGVHGIQALVDLRGQNDLFERPLVSTEIGYADEIAAGASLIMGQAGEARPAVLVRGLGQHKGNGRTADLIRPLEIDLFQ
jgi:coenzyme F420-0:L-glutamate ligase / coenzyme F420-1:gamma-L-glutamate ligase